MTITMNRREYLESTAAAIAGMSVPLAVLGCGDEAATEMSSSTTDEALEAFKTKAASLEASMVYDKGTQWMGMDKANTHVPAVTLSGTTAMVETPHVLTAAHYITALYLKDQTNQIIAFLELEQPAAGDAFPKATATFVIPAGTTKVTAFSHCNLHDVWKSDPVNVA
jgi:desulfoferrodoxin (superoxide reductase-like protein)